MKSAGGCDQAKHLPDAAVQLYVLLGSGVDVRRVSLMHLNKTYVYPGGGWYDPKRVLAPTDITAEAFDYIERVPAHTAEMMRLLAQPEPPEAPAGINCKAPYECEFLAWCTRDVIQPDLSGPVETVPAVLGRLDGLPFPLYFVDFETLNPGLPVFAGTRPFQIAKVQWSIHALQADGSLEHAEWLTDDASGDPSSEFMRTLLEALGTEGTFVHYSPYERTQLVDIAKTHAQWRQPLIDRIPGFYEALTEKLATCGISYADLRRPDTGGLVAFDLGARVVKDGCLHPVFGPDNKGWSIKAAIKVLAPDLPPYASLAIGNGGQAMTATQQMLDPATAPELAAAIRADLLTYCEQDTMSMVEIYRTLRAIG